MWETSVFVFKTTFQFYTIFYSLSKAEYLKEKISLVNSTMVKHKKYRDLHEHEQFIHTCEKYVPLMIFKHFKIRVHMFLSIIDEKLHPIRSSRDVNLFWRKNSPCLLQKWLVLVLVPRNLILTLRSCLFVCFCFSFEVHFNVIHCSTQINSSYLCQCQYSFCKECLQLKKLQLQSCFDLYAVSVKSSPCLIRSIVISFNSTLVYLQGFTFFSAILTHFSGVYQQRSL